MDLYTHDTNLVAGHKPSILCIPFENYFIPCFEIGLEQKLNAAAELKLKMQR